MTSRLQLVAAISAIALSVCTTASAFDLSGAWANRAEACDKIFVKKDGSTDFKPKSDIHGSGFIVDRDQIRGRFARCRITSRKEGGELVNLLAACSTDIMLSNVQFSIKVRDDNTILRQFPGMEGMEVEYVRCPIR